MGANVYLMLTYEKGLKEVGYCNWELDRQEMLKGLAKLNGVREIHEKSYVHYKEKMVSS